MFQCDKDSEIPLYDKAQALEVVGQGSGDVDFLAAHWVGEAYAVGLQRDAPVGIAAGSAIFEIPLDGAADGRQLRPDLVFASRDQVHLKQPVALACGNDAVFQHRLLMAFAGHDAHMGLVVALHALEVVGERSLLFGWLLAHHGPVGLVDLALAEQFVHARQPFAGACHYHQAAGGPVDAVRHAQENIARLVIFFLDPLLHRIDERRVTGAVALHQLTGTFVDDDDVVVFINYFHACSKIGQYHASHCVAAAQSYRFFPNNPNDFGGVL